MFYKFILCIAVLVLISAFNIKEKSQSFSYKLHQTCLLQALKNQQHSNEVSALICGKKITQVKIKDLFITNGLIHIFVVSGAHLALYKKLFRLVLPRWATNITTTLFLLMYTFTCLFSAPIFRAFIQQLNIDINRFLKLNISKNTILLFTGLITTLTVPTYLKSVSLPMSWVAALCMSQKNSPAKTLVVFLSLFPILLTFTEPNPLSVFSGFFVSGIISIFILPLNLLVFLIPKLSFILGAFYNCFYYILELIQPTIPMGITSKDSQLTTLISWAYAIILNICLILNERINQKTV